MTYTKLLCRICQCECLPHNKSLSDLGSIDYTIYVEELTVDKLKGENLYILYNLVYTQKYKINIKSEYI